jgi:hypothetical protein
MDDQAVCSGSGQPSRIRKDLNDCGLRRVNAQLRGRPGSNRTRIRCELRDRRRLTWPIRQRYGEERENGQTKRAKQERLNVERLVRCRSRCRMRADTANPCVGKCADEFGAHAQVIPSAAQCCGIFGASGGDLNELEHSPPGSKQTVRRESIA